MIVNHSNEGWEIITQTAHAYLAVQVAKQVASHYKSDFEVETLLATLYHETHDTDFNTESCISNMGTPLDFTESEATTAQTLSKIKKVTEKARLKSSLVFALIAQHFQTIHSEEAKNPKIKEVFAQFKNETKQILKNYHISTEQFKELSHTVLFADRLSLVLCKNEIPAENREIEINTSLNNATYFLKEDATQLTVRPWCFTADQFLCRVEYRLLTQASFKDEKDFYKHFQEAPVLIKKWNFRK